MISRDGRTAVQAQCDNDDEAMAARAGKNYADAAVIAPSEPPALPGGHVTSLQRREQFQRDHPDTKISHDAPIWTGSLPVCGRRREVTRDDLGALLDALDGLAALDAQAQQVERDFSDWRVWLSDLNRWWAVRQRPDARRSRQDQRPLTVDADDSAGLRAALAKVERRHAN